MKIKKRAVRYALSVENEYRRHPAVPLGTVCEPTHSVPNGTRRAGVFAFLPTLCPYGAARHGEGAARNELRVKS
ncbi:MAG: hypothetical protein LBF19_03105 [Prevotellaceae bacterium]|nr:hypothetical protein [Prevotellaceae bacterium]